MEGTARGVVPFLLANQPSDWRINPARPGPANDNLDMALLKLMQIRVGTSALRAAPTSRPFLVCKSFLIEDWAAELRRRSRRALQYACADHLADPAEDLDRTAVVRALDGLIRRPPGKDHDGGQTGCTGLCARGCRVRLLILIEEEFRTAKGIRILLPRHPSVSLQGSSSCRGSRPFVCKLLQAGF